MELHIDSVSPTEGRIFIDNLKFTFSYNTKAIVIIRKLRCLGYKLTEEQEKEIQETWRAE